MSGTHRARIAAATTLLFVPGDRPERFDKAARSGADVVIIDLEDAVAPEQADTALANVRAAMADGTIEAVVRVHGTSDRRHAVEVATLLDTAEPLPGLLGFVVAKAEDPEALAVLGELLGPDRGLVPLVESAAGIGAARSVAGVPGVVRLAFGAVDYSLDIAALPEPEPLAAARSELVLASRLARITAPLDSPPTDVADLAAVAQAGRRARAFGFSGSLAIHPAQLPALRQAFAPSPDEVAWAVEVLSMEGAAGATQLHGQLLDRPVFDRARAVVARADQQSR